MRTYDKHDRKVTSARVCTGPQPTPNSQQGPTPLAHRDGDITDVRALKYQEEDVVRLAQLADFDMDRVVVEPLEGMSMNALYLEGTRGSTSERR